MAGKHSTHVSKIPTICQERQLTVRAGYYPYQLAKTAPGPAVPWIRLKGYWIEQAGFTIGRPVKVRVMAGCLVLTVED